ncbi:MAG: hypothetical protein LBT89_09340, partial [Planctomycetaceae bacterium]|nr:hypothetical protein [Planctomycetaceae bacterium]
VYVRPREDGRSVIEILDKTREEGKKIILIVDEAYRNYFTENSQKFIRDVIKPRLTFEVSATPLMTPSGEDLAEEKAGFVKVPFDNVVESGLIKRETHINKAIGNYTEFASSADEVVLHAALMKRDELAGLYGEQGINVKPLMLVQLPSERKNMLDIDISMRSEVEELLKQKGITYENKKLAVWLSDEKVNFEGIEQNDNGVEVLIFKEAVAVGWDCPRAQVLVMLRPIRSITFEIQTVGRILRMPEAKHYDEEALNQAFVYTNLQEIIINREAEGFEFFKHGKTAYLKDGIQNVSLPSVYLKRTDYGDLMQRFEDVLVEVLNEHCGITHETDYENNLAKAKKFIETDAAKLAKPILADVVLENIDIEKDITGGLDIQTIQMNVSPENLQRELDYLAQRWSMPYQARSYQKVKQSLYRWFKNFNWEYRYRDKQDLIHRIVTCSEKNQRFFSDMCDIAKKRYESVRAEEIAAKRKRTDFEFRLPPSDDFSDSYELVESIKKCPYDKCYLQKKRSEPERRFEQALEESGNVEWWYKNGVQLDRYFAVEYESENKRRAFYPDYIVRYTDGRIGIYDTKSRITTRDPETKAKAEALQRYISEVNSRLGLTVCGGIVNLRKDVLYLQNSKDYQYEDNNSKWQRWTE